MLACLATRHTIVCLDLVVILSLFFLGIPAVLPSKIHCKIIQMYDQNGAVAMLEHSSTLTVAIKQVTL